MSLVGLAALVAASAEGSGLRHDVWQTDHGLPHDVVRTVAQTPDGYLWIGMTNALARFDGVRIVPVAREQTVSTQVTCLATNREGRLLVATLAGLFWLDRERLVPLGEKPKITSVRSITVDRNGFVWAGTELGLFRIAPAGGARPEAILNDVFVSTLVTDSNGFVWAGTRKGLFRIRADAPTANPPENWLPGESTVSVLPLAGEVLAGTDGHGLFSLRAGAAPVRIYEQQLGRNVIALGRDRTGSVWVGTWESGLYLISGNQVTRPVAVASTGTQVMTVFDDREGNIWAGTRGSGLHRFRRQLVQNFSAADGLPHSLVWSATETTDGTVWLGTDGGLAYIHDGRVGVLGESAGLPAGVVTTVAAAPDGTLYAGTPGRGIARIRNGKAAKLPIPDALGTTLNNLFVDRSGRLWVSSMKGLLLVEGDTVVRRFSTADGLPTPGIRSVSQGPDGSIWATTSKGVVRIRGEELTVFDRSQTGAVVSARSATHDAGGVWVATQGSGLCRLESERFHCFGREQGLPDSDIYRAVPDNRGYLWLTSAVGLHRIAISDFDRVREGTAPEVRVFSLGQADGMGSDTCTGGIQPGAYLASNGVLWVPTLKGVSALDVNRPLAAPSPNPIIERVVSGGEHGRNLQVEFAAPLLTGSRRIEFRYRLEPFDRHWITVDDRRTAYYTNLPPDRYSFRLAVRNQDAEWVEAPNPAPFEVRPLFYETAWFRTLAGCAIALAILLFVRLRLRAAARRRAELTRMVEERTRELEQARVRLERADAAKSNFLSFISHEIRTPLNGILAMTSLWHTFRSEDDHRQALETIESCGEALLGIVTNVLDLTRIEAGRLDLEPSVVSPRSLVERAVAVVSMQAAQKGIEVRSTIDASMPEAVHADGTRLRQVLLNLLGNAVKFTDRGSVQLTATAHRQPDGQWRLRFCVRDSGIGIDPTMVPNLFEPFSHASNTTARKYGGSGLGLSISRRIVRAMDGDIQVTSSPGQGSTFEFDVLVREALPEPQAALDRGTSEPGRPQERDVLIVEDNKVNQIVASRMLTALGCRVDVAESGVEALRMLESAPGGYRVVFMDCMMPELDGYETTRRIRQMPAHANIPVIAMTADAFSWSRDRAFAAGMNSYLTKPLRIDEVRRELSAWT